VLGGGCQDTCKDWEESAAHLTSSGGMLGTTNSYFQTIIILEIYLREIYLREKKRISTKDLNNHHLPRSA